MGYTHYWWRKSTANDQERYDQFKALALSVIRAAKDNDIDLSDGLGRIRGAWEVTDEHVTFNGYPDSYECFYFAKKLPHNVRLDSKSRYYDFCKTNHKQYDAAVTATLIALKSVYEEDVIVSSDGTWDEWIAGRALFEAATGQKPKNIFVYNPNKLT